MNVRSGVASAAILSGAFALGASTGAPARAQYSVVRIPSSAEQTGGAPPRKVNAVFQVFPYTPFQYKASFDDLNGHQEVTALDNGFLLASEAAFANARGRGGYAVGGWYWFRTNSLARATTPILSQKAVAGTLYELHGKYYFTQQVGVQFGYTGISGGVTKGSAYDYLLLYTLTSPKAPYTVQVGVGGYHTSVDTRNPVDATALLQRWRGTYGTAFINGSVDLGKNVTLDMSYWYLRANRLPVETPGFPDTQFRSAISRFAVGVGYRL